MPESDNLNTVPVTDIPSSPARLAPSGYEAYGGTTDHKNYQGLPMPSWDELPDKQKTAWRAATAAIVQRYIDTLDAGALNYAIGAPSIDANLISDGYHTFKELYDHRIELYIQLAKAHSGSVGAHTPVVWRSKRHSDGELAYGGGWFVLGIGTEPGKQITYHLPLSRWDDCAFAEEFTNAPEWDQHTPSDVLQRLKSL